MIFYITKEKGIIMSRCTKTERSRSKGIRITRTSTCLDIFDYTEVRYACDKYKKYLDPLSNIKKQGGGSCDQL